MEPIKSTLDQVMELLVEAGFKRTKKRQDMLMFLLRSDRYLSAKEIYNHLKNNYAGISYDTVYRNLREFTDLSLIEMTEIYGEKRFRFCYQPNTEHHHYFICTVCGKTMDIHMCPMNFFEQQLEGAMITGHRFEILGYCESCRKK